MPHMHVSLSKKQNFPDCLKTYCLVSRNKQQKPLLYKFFPDVVEPMVEVQHPLICVSSFPYAFYVTAENSLHCLRYTSTGTSIRYNIYRIHGYTLSQKKPLKWCIRVSVYPTTSIGYGYVTPLEYPCNTPFYQNDLKIKSRRDILQFPVIM
jgi:hypothetical protein